MTSISLYSMSVCRSEELQARLFRDRLQTPTLIGCVFLMNTTSSLDSASRFAVISEALHYSMRIFLFQTLVCLQILMLVTRKPPFLSKRGLRGWCKSLMMTYFHTGIRTIIGAEAFHCPVRDGKEWDHLAMVIRHNWFVREQLSWRTNS